MPEREERGPGREVPVHLLCGCVFHMGILVVTKAESGPRSSRWTTTTERWKSEFLVTQDRAISSRVRNRDEGRCVLSHGI